MRRNETEIAALDAKIWLEKQRCADPKTGHTDSSIGTECFEAIKQYLKAQEPDADPWDQRVIAALDGYDERHKPMVSPDPQQPRLLQPKAEWKLDRVRRVSIDEGRANGDDIDLRQSLLRTQNEEQQAIFQKEDAFLSESKRRGKRKDSMTARWKPERFK